MSSVKEKNCRLCLKMLDNEFYVIDETTRAIFEVLLLKVDLSISEEPVLCQICMESLRKAYDFKSTCISANDQVVSFAVDRNSVELDIRDVFLKNNEDKSLAFSVDHNICRFCLRCQEKSNFDLSIDLRDSTDQMLVKCIPEVDLNMIKESVICVTCVKFLKSYYSFANMCQNTEENILKYYEVQGARCNEQISLSNVLNFLFKCKVEDTDNCSKTTTLKGEVKLLKIEDTYSDINNIAIKIEQEELVIKTEDMYKDLKAGESSCGEMKCKEVTMCDKLTQADFSKVVMYRCEMCSFETKYKSALKKHMPDHKDNSEVIMYKCKFCSYEGKKKECLKKHMLTCKDSTDVIMYKCENCTFETKYKNYLKKHMLVHKNNSEVAMYKCYLCKYEAKKKVYLKNHMLTHKDSSDVVMYKCERCAFESKYKHYLKKHMNVHKDKSEMITYKCNLCSYESKRKRNLGRHMLIHKDSSDVVMYKCDKCTFETKHKDYLKMHVLIHKFDPEVFMYKCNLCSYESKKKGCVKKHKLLHEDSADVAIYRCERCPYKTKNKGALKRHLVIHKCNSERSTYNCNLCSYETKRKGCLRRHMLTHEDSLDV